VSFQEIVGLAQEVTKGNDEDERVWNDLAKWVDRKITATRTNAPAASTIF
jgi:hypothetical protein